MTPTRKQVWRTSCAALTTLGLLQPTALFAAQPDITTGPRSSAMVASMQVPPSSEPGT